MHASGVGNPKSFTAPVLCGEVVGDKVTFWGFRIFSILCLNGCFIIQGEYCCMLSIQTMSFKPVFRRDSGNRHMRDISEFVGQFALAPVRRTGRQLFLNRPFKNADLLISALFGSTSDVPREQAEHAVSEKPILPSHNEIGVTA
jgi:hypothetical protein